MSVELQIAMWVVGTVLTICAGGWALIRAFAYLGEKLATAFEAKLNVKFGAIEQQLQAIVRVGEERLGKLEKNYEELAREMRTLLIELPREYVRQADYVKRETVLEAKLDLVRMEIRGMNKEVVS